MDYRLEVVVDSGLGRRPGQRVLQEARLAPRRRVVADGDFRLVQVTPPGSACSIQFGAGLTTAAPGSARATHLAVSDIAAARADLVGRGIKVSEVYHCESGFACRYGVPGEHGPRVPGPAPAHATYASFASFADPDGNEWVLQEITTRLPGR